MIQASYNVNQFATEFDNLTIIDLLKLRAECQPDQPIYTFWQGSDACIELTFSDLHQQARAIAAHLQHLNAFEERAILLYPPGLDFIAAFFGSLYAGVVAVPAYLPRRNQNLERLQSVAADAEATMVLTTADCRDKLKQRTDSELDFFPTHWIATDDLPSESTTHWQHPSISSEFLAFLQYTSGSTGNPKGVMVSHGNLLHNSEVIHHQFGHSYQSRGMIWLPPYHDMGLIGGVLQPLYGGFPVMLMSPVDFLQKPFRWLQAISDFQATTSGGPNFAYELCCRKVSQAQLEKLDLSSWEVAFTGAEPIRPDTINLFTKTFAPCGFRREVFYPCYGMAESTLMVTGGIKNTAPNLAWIDSIALEEHKIVLRSESSSTAKPVVGCGSALANQQVVIVDPVTQVTCGENQVGEVWIQSDSVALGYWHKPDLTQAAFQAHRKDTDDGPFLRTGDLGFMLGKELFITGRIKDIIIIRGQNHYPQDIELTVENSHPALRPASGAAFAIEGKNSELLVILQEVERSYLRRLDDQTIITSIRQNVVATHSIKPYAIVLIKPGSIPKTSSGKIRRMACREAFLNKTLKVIDDWSENPKLTCKYLGLEADIESTFQKVRLKHFQQDRT